MTVRHDPPALAADRRRDRAAARRADALNDSGAPNDARRTGASNDARRTSGLNDEGAALEGVPPDGGARQDRSATPDRHVPARLSRRARAGGALAVLVILGLIAALVITNLRISSRPALSTQQVSQIASQQVSSAMSQLQAAPPVGQSVYQAVQGGLVVVEARRAGSAGGDDLGSGVVIDTAGDILTALHVVQGASAIEVIFADGTVSPATVSGTETSSDIAELVPSRLPQVMQPLVLGSSPQVGDEAFVVGNPLGLAGSLSAGVISGLDRTFAPTSGHTLSGMIQFDAAVNPGSSGGPLLNTKGQVIGIVVGLANPVGSNAFAGIGFAVPIATAGGAAGAPPK